MSILLFSTLSSATTSGGSSRRGTEVEATEDVDKVGNNAFPTSSAVVKLKTELLCEGAAEDVVADVGPEPVLALVVTESKCTNCRSFGLWEKHMLENALCSAPEYELQKHRTSINRMTNNSLSMKYGICNGDLG